MRPPRMMISLLSASTVVSIVLVEVIRSAEPAEPMFWFSTTSDTSWEISNLIRLPSCTCGVTSKVRPTSWR